MPLLGLQRGVRRFNHANGGDRISGSDDQFLCAADCRTEVPDLISERSDFVVAVAENRPVLLISQFVFGFFPADGQSPL